MTPKVVSSLERTESGLEFLQKIIAGEYANVPIGDHVGFHLVEATKGRVVLVGQPQANVLNLLGTVHGGYTASILDTALALSILSTLDVGHAFTTLEIKVSYVRAIAPGMDVRAIGEVLNVGRRVGTSEARLEDGAGKLLAHGTTTCLVIPR